MVINLNCLFCIIPYSSVLNRIWGAGVVESFVIISINSLLLDLSPPSSSASSPSPSPSPSSSSYTVSTLSSSVTTPPLPSIPPFGASVPPSSTAPPRPPSRPRRSQQKIENVNCGNHQPKGTFYSLSHHYTSNLAI